MATDAYQLLDSGGGRKLERFGEFVLDRPCAQAVWRPRLPESQWRNAHGYFTREQGNHWEFRKREMRQGWQCTVGNVRFLLKPTDFGHVGVFPEHSLGWQLIQEAAQRHGERQLSVLNLFAYSGGATLAAAAAGCQVCHLDASKKMVEWARENAAINGLTDAPIRWIVDDVFKFVQREERRGRRYDGIVLDPPSFGRGTNQELFQIDAAMLELLEHCRRLLSDNPAFVMLSCHTPGYTPVVLDNLVRQTLPPGKRTAGEMILPAAPGADALPSGCYLWWESDEK